MKKLILVGLVGTLAACGPAQQPPPDQSTQPPPPAAQTAPAPAAAAPSAPDQEETRLKAEEHKVRHEEAELRAEQKAQRVEAQQAVAAAPPPPQPACQDCGVVASITPIKKEGQAGWLGTLGGAAAGGLAGSQFGKGKGNTAMAVIGVLGGALAGREVQKQVDTTTVYQIAVNMETGGTRTVTIDRADGLTVGKPCPRRRKQFNAVLNGATAPECGLPERTSYT